MNIQKAVTTLTQNNHEEVIMIRSCSEPNQQVRKLYAALKYKYAPFVKRKSVVHKSKTAKLLNSKNSIRINCTLGLNPIMSGHDNPMIKGQSVHFFVFALPKFTIPDQKYLAVQLMKMNGDKHLEMGYPLQNTCPFNGSILSLENYQLFHLYSFIKTKVMNQKNAWVQMDFKQAGNNGNYTLKQYHQNYGFDLDQVLTKHPIKKPGHVEQKSKLLNS